MFHDCRILKIVKALKVSSYAISGGGGESFCRK